MYEQASQIREVGAGIGLRPSTMDRFRQWGIFDAIAKVSSPSDYFEILTATGDPIMKESWPEIDTFEVRTKTHLIHRGDFIEALVGVLPEGMVHLGHKLETVEDQGDRSVLTFANGTTVEADLVVGADGIKSTVRQQLFSDKEPVFSGEHAYRVVIYARRRPRAGHRRQPADVHRPRHEGLLPAAAPPQPDVLRRHRAVPGRHLDAGGHQGRPAADRRGLRRADRRHRPATSTWTP